MTSRDFRIQGAFGLSIALATTSTGVISVTLPRYGSKSSQSTNNEPLMSVASIPVLACEDSDPSPLERTESNDSVTTQPDTNDVETTEEVFDDSQFVTSQESDLDLETARRAPSPAPTEIQHPEPEDIALDLERRGIKVRDFAYETPLPSVEESFCLMKAIAEFDYRTGQVPRAYPVPGKTIRRLLNEGWLTEEEVERRCSDEEKQLLKEYDARPQHPYYCTGDNTPLAPETREGNKMDYMPGFYHLDKQWTIMEARRRYEEEAREEAALAYEKMKKEREERERALAELSPKSRKRVLEEMIAGYFPTYIFGNDAKRRRTTPEADSPASSQSQPQSQPRVHPAFQKQYPAPLSSYDPEIYPEAAGVILSQGRTEPPPRIPTPPQPNPPSQGRNPLRRGLKRTLSRTQTFTQL